MLGGRKRGFGLFKTHLTEETTTYIIVGVDHETENVTRYGTCTTVNEVKEKLNQITDRGITLSVYTEENRTVYREVR
jgi:hypothetical protein